MLVDRVAVASGGSTMDPSRNRAVLAKCRVGIPERARFGFLADGSATTAVHPLFECNGNLIYHRSSMTFCACISVIDLPCGRFARRGSF
jgi:hypothetical protein